MVIIVQLRNTRNIHDNKTVQHGNQIILTAETAYSFRVNAENVQKSR